MPGSGWRARRPTGARSRADRAAATGTAGWWWPGNFDRSTTCSRPPICCVAPCAEGSPVAVLEAMAAGLPIVAADAAANRSLLADGREGLLVAADDAAALGGRIAGLCREPGPGRRLGRGGPGAGRGRVLSCQNGRPARNMVREIGEGRPENPPCFPSLDRAGAEKQMSLLARACRGRSSRSMSAPAGGGPLRPNCSGRRFRHRARPTLAGRSPGLLAAQAAHRPAAARSGP